MSTRPPFTLADRNAWPDRWNPATAQDEGYVAGYFIESAINHYTLTEGMIAASTTRRNSWRTAGSRTSGHGARRTGTTAIRKMEQALVRLDASSSTCEQRRRKDAELAASARLPQDGSEYDQSHTPSNSNTKPSATPCCHSSQGG